MLLGVLHYLPAFPACYFPSIKNVWWGEGTSPTLGDAPNPPPPSTSVEAVIMKTGFCTWTSLSFPTPFMAKTP